MLLFNSLTEYYEIIKAAFLFNKLAFEIKNIAIRSRLYPAKALYTNQSVGYSSEFCFSTGFEKVSLVSNSVVIYFLSYVGRKLLAFCSRLSVA